MVVAYSSATGSGGPMGSHGFEKVEHDGERYVLVCRCGWRSSAQPSARVVGDEWDRHRAAAQVASA